MAAYPGKDAARRQWLDRVIEQLAIVYDACIELGQPALAARVVDARNDAQMLRARVGA